MNKIRDLHLYSSLIRLRVNYFTLTFRFEKQTVMVCVLHLFEIFSGKTDFDKVIQVKSM